MKEWCLLNGRDVILKPNDKLRCRVRCKDENCEWLCFVNKVGGSDTFRLKTLKSKHTYVKTIKGHLASFNWVAEKIMQNSFGQQKVRIADITEMV